MPNPQEPQQLRAGENISVWEDGVPPGSIERLPSDLTADICIIGAGIAGLSIAYELAKAGRAVTVLDDGVIGSGMTGRTTAHLVNALDDRYYDLEKYHGEDGARLAAQSHSAAIDRVEAIARAEKIDCDFERVDGFLFEPPGETQKNLDREFEACGRAGLKVERVERAPFDNFETGPAIRFPGQGQFHPLKYAHGLVDAIVLAGGQIFTGTRATEMQGGEEAFVKTEDGKTIKAAAIVVATNTPINDRYEIHAKQSPYTTYVLAFRLPENAVPHVLWWDTAEEAKMEERLGPVSYHYVRTARDAEGEVLIVGGRDHKTGQADDWEKRWDDLEAWTRERFPAARKVAYRWSGQVMEPVDSLAFIGRNPADAENVYVVTGDSGNGMTHGAIAGLLISDLILGKSNPWAKLYDPSRKTVRAAVDFAKENLNVAAQYRDFVTAGDVATANSIAPGAGAVLREGLSKIAVYRDDEGTLHKMSAVCPHLKCVVRWNGAEKSWDCPCHGSRFDCLGNVMNGPATSRLEFVPAE